jgi:hypothetical protein
VARIGKRASQLVILCAIICFHARPASATQLQPQTVAAFDSYIRATEERMADDLRQGDFLIIDRLPESRRNEIYSQLRQGQLYIQQLHTKEDGKAIPVPNGLIHHWIGVAFIPGVTLQETLTVLQDYNNHKTIYKPDERDSKLLEHNGNEFKVYLQFYRKSLVTVVENVNFDIHYTLLGSTRAMSKGYSTRIAEVADFGKPSEHELPVGNDHGYLWRLYTYWGVEEKDEGVYVQIESVGLSRTIPWEIAWIVNPLIRSIPRNVLSGLLNHTREAVESAAKSRPASQVGNWR